MLQEFARELEVARRLAREAGRAILRHYADDFRIDYKEAGESGLVTAADRDANQIIVSGLSREFPEDGILAEESTDSPRRLHKERLWCVDPLDGTREYAERNGEFVVMIGLAIEGQARAGVVYQPTEDVLWWGVDGVAVEEASGASRPLRVSTCADPAAALMPVSRSHRSKTVSRIAARLGIARQELLGSVGLKVARVARGNADLYMSATHRTMEWDACAPEAVIRAAGGAMTDMTGEPLRYNKEIPNTPRGMLASNALLHDAALRATAFVAAERGL